MRDLSSIPDRPAGVSSALSIMGSYQDVFDTFVLMKTLRAVSVAAVLLLPLFAARLSAGNISITLNGATPTQAVVSYSVPVGQPCNIALSENSSMVPPVHDVDAALFPGSDNDSRPGNSSNGVVRTTVLGKRAVEHGSDGNSYSRALQAYTMHYLSVVCGSDSGTFKFRTQDPPLGNTYPEVPLFDASAFGNYAVPTIDLNDQSKTYIDPLSGILLKRATKAGDLGDASPQNIGFPSVVDVNSAWTSPAAFLGNSGTASYGGTGTSADYLFLPPSVPFYGASGYYAYLLMTDLRMKFYGTGTESAAPDRTMSTCLSTDNGQTCATAVLDFPALPQGAAAQVQVPSNYPSAVFAGWTAPGTTPIITPHIRARTGNVTISGTAVTLNSGDTFDDMVPGQILTVPGSGCPKGDQCVIASLTNATHLVIATPAAITADFTAANFGIKIWKKTAVGSVSINNALFDWAWDTPYVMGSFGEVSNCSSVLATTTIDRNGNPLSAALNGFLCTFLDATGTARLYWHGTNGEVRHISNLTRPGVYSPAADAIQSYPWVCPSGAAIEPTGDFDDTDANSLYCAGNRTGNNQYDVIYKCTYNPKDTAWGNYREWSSGYDRYAENPAESCVNITKASLGMDLQSQIPGLDPNYFHVGGGDVKGRYMTLTARTQQDGMGYFIRFDTVTAKVVYFHDSWSSAPARWGVIHAKAANVTPNYGFLILKPMVASDVTGQGIFLVPLFSIDGLSDTSLSSTYVDARTCEALGVTNQAFIAGGATGNKCIAVNVLGEPANPAPSSADLARFPSPSNATACGGDGSENRCWSYLQPDQEGDYMADSAQNGYQEQFRIVNKISSTRLILQRGASAADCTETQFSSHPAGWAPQMWLQGACNGVYDFFDTSGNVLVDATSMDNNHHDILTDSESDSGLMIQSGYQFRTGTMASQIGKPPTFQSYPLFAPTYSGSIGTTNVAVFQSHPSARQHIAPPNERRWALDARPYAPNLSGNSIFSNTVAPTAVAGVYKVSAPTLNGTPISQLDRKHIPMHVWAGRFLLADKSGPASVLSASDIWKYCVADFAGECVPGSSSGDVYMNVPQMVTSGTCDAQWSSNTPCWLSASSAGPSVNQVGLYQPDAAGLTWRRVSSYMNGLGWSESFWNARSIPDGSWVFSDSWWINGYHTELMTAKMPPWPPADSLKRNTFIPVTVQISAVVGKTYRVRFGYDTNLYCTTRQEQCATVVVGSTDPFQWVSENQSWMSCTGPCQILIPAISDRVLYYSVDAKDSTGAIASTPLSAYAVP